MNIKQNENYGFNKLFAYIIKIKYFRKEGIKSQHNQDKEVLTNSYHNIICLFLLLFVALYGLCSFYKLFVLVTLIYGTTTIFTNYFGNIFSDIIRGYNSFLFF